MQETPGGHDPPTNGNSDGATITYANSVKGATKLRLLSGNSVFGVRKTAANTIAFDVTNIYFADSKFLKTNHIKINMTGMQFTDYMITEYERYGAVGGNFRPKNKVIEIYFENPDQRNEALEQEWSFEGTIFKPLKTFNNGDHMMKIDLQPLPVCDEFGRGEELEEYLMKAFAPFGEPVAAKHHMFCAGSKHFSNRASIIIIPNEKVLEDINIIPREIEFGNIITYVDPKNAPVRCYRCKELGHIKYECDKIHKERRRVTHSQLIEAGKNLTQKDYVVTNQKKVANPTVLPNNQIETQLDEEDKPPIRTNSLEKTLLNSLNENKKREKNTNKDQAIINKETLRSKITNGKVEPIDTALTTTLKEDNNKNNDDDDLRQPKLYKNNLGKPAWKATSKGLTPKILEEETQS